MFKNIQLKMLTFSALALMEFPLKFRLILQNKYLNSVGQNFQNQSIHIRPLVAEVYACNENCNALSPNKSKFFIALEKV